MTTFATVRLGKDSVADIEQIDVAASGIQAPPYVLQVVCKQVPKTLEEGAIAIVWLGSDNSKGIPTKWKQGIRAVARIVDLQLGENHNDDSRLALPIGYIFRESIDKIDLIDHYAEAYKHFSMLPLVGLNDYSNQTVREIDLGPRKDIGALLAACGKVSKSSLEDIVTVYPELKELIRNNYGINPDGQDVPKSNEDINEPRNLIYFGAPGTGKSYQLEKLAKEGFDADKRRRVTFYPDYTYAQFVGGYKPTMKGDDIRYDFVPGPFMKTYMDAVMHPNDDYLLIVEEINRANPAGVFGDIFQLLDRDAQGASDYYISVPKEMSAYIEEQLDRLGAEEQQSIEACCDPDMDFQEYRDSVLAHLSLPPNMYIWATMNSADQGVFPMDTAFKRRWSFRYVGIDEGEDVIAGIDVPLGSKSGNRAEWNVLRKQINELLKSARVNEDKLLGPFFIEPRLLEDDDSFLDAFKSNVLMYLIEDAAKTKKGNLFTTPDLTYSAIARKFDTDGEGIFKDMDLKYTNVRPEEPEAEEIEEPEETESMD